MNLPNCHMWTHNSMTLIRFSSMLTNVHLYWTNQSTWPWICSQSNTTRIISYSKLSNLPKRKLLRFFLHGINNYIKCKNYISINVRFTYWPFTEINVGFWICNFPVRWYNFWCLTIYIHTWNITKSIKPVLKQYTQCINSIELKGPRWLNELGSWIT